MDSKTKKPKGRMSAYTYFVQMCREEHRKKHPNESVNFTEFSKKCAERWKQMNEPEKKRFADMAEKDKVRYDKEMASYAPPTEAGGRRKKKKKDPNAPKRPLSAFFLFCADERPNVKAQYPQYSVGEAAKELGERWNKVSAELKAQYEAKVALDKTRYERELEGYQKRSADIAADECEEEDEEEE
ncbi:High mobility group DSP1 [Brachionus plicatilis]|uniref:High mobility group DSP1 n=1 Tax=Brachionus plicatilis TaxID=10195 RepID=A0A3M7QAM9_BRAPC|nr:High mobility group DSP1 [Brachionus plicatilis]